MATAKYDSAAQSDIIFQSLMKQQEKAEKASLETRAKEWYAREKEKYKDKTKLEEAYQKWYHDEEIQMEKRLLGEKDKLLYIDEDWSTDSLDPKLSEKEISFSD